MKFDTTELKESLYPHLLETVRLLDAIETIERAFPPDSTINGLELGKAFDLIADNIPPRRGRPRLTDTNQPTTYNRKGSITSEVKELIEIHPEGITVGEIAETIGANMKSVRNIADNLIKYGYATKRTVRDHDNHSGKTARFYPLTSKPNGKANGATTLIEAVKETVNSSNGLTCAELLSAIGKGTSMSIRGAADKLAKQGEIKKRTIRDPHAHLGRVTRFFPILVKHKSIHV